VAPKEIISSGLLEIYAAGLASAEEILQVQESARNHPEVAAELFAIEQSVESYITSFAATPSPSVKEKIFEKINGNGAIVKDNAKAMSLGDVNTAPAKVLPIGFPAKRMAAAAVVLLAGSVALNVMLYNKNNAAATQLAKTQVQLAAVEDKAKAMEEDMHVVQSRYSMPVSLTGMDNAPDAAAKVFWMKNSGEVYIDPSNLPDAPGGKQYQLWAIVDGQPVDGGMILTSKKGSKYRIQKMKTFGRAEAFAVTLESESGNTSPKGPMYVMGKM
jgi:hypothetical protein